MLTLLSGVEHIINSWFPLERDMPSTQSVLGCTMRYKTLTLKLRIQEITLSNKTYNEAEP